MPEYQFYVVSVEQAPSPSHKLTYWSKIKASPKINDKHIWEESKFTIKQTLKTWILHALHNP